MFPSLLFRSNAEAGPSTPRPPPFSSAPPTPKPAPTSTSGTILEIEPDPSNPHAHAQNQSRSLPGPGGVRRNFDKTYTGPDRATLAEPRTRSQADKYFARVANENILPGRWHKAVGIAGWAVGGFACFYMALFADFGPREHVFSPLRRYYRSFTQDLVTLSPEERSVLGLDAPPRRPGLEESLRDPTRRPT